MGKINFINSDEKGMQFFINMPDTLEDAGEMYGWFKYVESFMQKTLTSFGGKKIDDMDDREVEYFYQTSNAKYGTVENHDDDFAVSISPLTESCNKFALMKEVITLIAALQNEGLTVSKWMDDFETAELAPISELNENDLKDIFFNSAYQKKMVQFGKRSFA